MKQFFPLHLALLFLPICAAAQRYDNHWVFGQKTGATNPIFGGTDIVFDGDTATAYLVNREVDFLFTNASICDKDGNLMFATNGIRVIGNDQQVIENGEGLNPGEVHDWWVDDGYTCAQGAIILPSTLRDSLFYIFHTRATASGMAICDKILRTTVDMRTNGGKGKVVEKNSTVSERDFAYGKITATKHANGRDWWVLMPHKSSNGYQKLLIVKDSIVDVQAQNVGPVYGVDDTRGQAVFSPDGTMYARYDFIHDLNIFNFDRCSGELSTAVHIPITDAADTSYIAGGLAFSPNSRFLYISSFDRVYQFDTWATDVADSKTTVAYYDGFELHSYTTHFYMAQLGPDGRIYISSLNQVNMLHVINRPDSPGLACDVRQHGLITPTLIVFGMPHFPNYRLGNLPASPCDTLHQAPQDTVDCGRSGLAYPNPATGYLDLVYCLQPGEAASVYIHDVLGRVALRRELAAGEKLHRIPLEGWASGSYFLCLVKNGRRGFVKKFVKIE